jgi:hypothetical protein
MSHFLHISKKKNTQKRGTMAENTDKEKEKQMLYEYGKCKSVKSYSNKPYALPKQH